MDDRKPFLAKALAELTGAKLVLARDDGSGRDFEKLPREKKVLVGDGPFTRDYHEGENVFGVDLWADMKTGSFLDQVDNHVRAGELAFGEGLDCFSYHGGFALALARRCVSVLAIEQDEAAAKAAKKNAERNGRSHVEVRQGNVFDVLRGFDQEQRKFDTIVLDPPGFAKRKEGLEAALRAYRELNLRALRCLRPDGLLVTCSCSGRLTREDFEAMVLASARDARRQLQLLERRGAGLDHPALAQLPETEYLKVFVYRAL
jgi:23S rRNA (cytosine1962-C5)-methyltransferase